jgi:hypothetical protein
MFYLNQVFDQAGDFTFYKFIADLNRADLEDRCGFDKGRLDCGAAVAVMAERELGQLTTADFTLGASTRWSRSRASAPWAPEFVTTDQSGTQRMQADAIESALALRGQNVLLLKEKVLNFMKRGKENVPAKVFPAWAHSPELRYPDAQIGVPQLQLQKKLHWVVMRIIPALH